ncbi:MAG TPA: archaemetzincin [Opitutaceae bacterium]|nr:archaemetzincin [Opitutaceae bacterium]
MNRVCCLILAVLACAPFAVAFEPPGPEARSQAIGLIDSLPETLRRAFDPGDAFHPIDPPEPGDWLDAHPEKGQTFDQFIASHPNRPDKSRSKIYLLPLGPLDSEGSPALEKLRSFAAAFFQMEVQVLPAAVIDEQTFSPRINQHTKRRQILTTDVLAYLRGKLPPDAFCLLGVTLEDLYPAPSWNYVFGQASLRERVGVYSFVRYDPEFFGEPRPPDYQALILRRSCKVLAHETAHMFGLPHCIYFHCLENGSNSLSESDRKPVDLCPVCLRKLQDSVGFDVVKRYEDLARFYRMEGWIAEAAWVSRRLVTITGR